MHKRPNTHFAVAEGALADAHAYALARGDDGLPGGSAGGQSIGGSCLLCRLPKAKAAVTEKQGQFCVLTTPRDTLGGQEKKNDKRATGLLCADDGGSQHTATFCLHPNIEK